MLNLLPALLGLLAFDIYLASLVYPCFTPNGESGIGALMFGVMGVFCCEFAWWANPCFVISLAVLHSSYDKNYSSQKRLEIARCALTVSIFGVLFSLLFLTQSESCYGITPATKTMAIEQLLLGYWLWVTSMVVMLLAALLQCKLLVGLREEELGGVGQT